ncbi:MAG: hypothetical protein ACRDNE_15960 [Gaiellaceae bacterium]
MKSILSYFASYFTPGGEAPYASHSTGQIARRLFEELGRRGEVMYVGEHPADGLTADLLRRPLLGLRRVPPPQPLRA